MPTGVDPRQVLAADLNSDGRPDLVVPSEASRMVSVLLGDGAGAGFTASTTIREVDAPTCAAIGDFNGDTLPDLAVFHRLFPFTTGGPSPGVSIFQNTGTGSFFRLVVVPLPSVVTAAVAVDFNRDTRVDLAMTSDFTVSVMSNTALGVFSTPSVVASGGLFTSLVAADFNTDGAADLATVDNARRNLVVMQGRQDGVFLGSRVFMTNRPTSPNWLAVAHVNADARPDLVQVDSGSASELTVWTNRDGTLFDPVVRPTLMDPVFVAAGDVNGDARTDLVISSRSDTRVAFHYGDGAGSFATAAILPVDFGTPAAGVALADLDANGRLDIVTVHPTRGEVRYLLNGGVESKQRQTITFTPPPALIFASQTIFLDARASSGLAVQFFSATPSVCYFLSATDNRLVIASAGLCTITLRQPGDATYDAAEAVSANLTVDRAPQTIFFSAIGTRPANESFLLQATASSALPVNFTVLSGPARISSGTLQFTGIGPVTVQAFQDGSLNYLPAVPVNQTFNAVLGRPVLRAISNGASYRPDIAPGAYVSLFGDSLYPVETPSNPADLFISIRDSAGVVRRAEVSYAGFGQANLLVPADVATGLAQVSAANSAGTSAVLVFSISRLAPGLFTADGNGRGTPAGQATLVFPDGSRDVMNLADCPIGANCRPVAIPFPADGQVVLTLYATGMQGAANVTAEIGGVRAAVLYAGPQGQYAGLQQINIAVPQSLAGRGLVLVRVNVDGQALTDLSIALR